MAPALRTVLLSPAMFHRLCAWMGLDRRVLPTGHVFPIYSIRWKTAVVFEPSPDADYRGPEWASLTDVDVWVTDQQDLLYGDRP